MSTPAAVLRSRMPRLAEAAVERARLTVVAPRRSQAARIPFVTLVTLLLVGGVVGLLLFNTSMQQASFAATALEQQATHLAAREQTLRMELDDLRDPQRVAEEAQRLRMVPAAVPAFLTLDGKVLGTPIAAKPEDGFRISPLPPAKPAALNPAPTIVTVTAPATGGQNKHKSRNDDTSAGSSAQRSTTGSND